MWLTILRSVNALPTPFPTDFRSSTLATWFWCAEQSRHHALGLVPHSAPTIATEQGTELHDEVLTKVLGRRYPWEDEFMETIEEKQDPVLGFHRKIGTTEIFDNITGHPDDFQITLDGEITILEHKTTGMKPKHAGFIERYKLPMAEFQVKIYCWIFNDLFSQLEGYRLARTHAVCFWSVNRQELTCELIDVYPITYYPVSVEADIKYALNAYKNPIMILPPREWKCKQCPKEHKEVCRFRGQTSKNI
jgi:hypothetical protein